MNVLLVIIFLGGVIFFHELGHFSVAKLFNVKVLEFALGFGPKILKKKIGETEYSLRALPLGGLVKMAGDETEDEVKPEDKGRTFLDKPVWQRILVILAGPVANLLLPVFLYFFIFAGTQEGTGTLVGYIIPESPAAKSGLMAGDHIRAINGEKTVLYSQLSKIIYKNPDTDMKLKVDRNGKPIELDIHTEEVKGIDPIGNKYSYGRIGVMFSYRKPDVGIISDDGPAAGAGLQNWDRIISVNGQKINNWIELQKLFAAGLSSEVKLKISRPKDVTKDGLKDENRTEREISIAFPPDIEKVHSTEELGFENSELYVAILEDDMPAKAMGIEKGDRLISVDGKKIVDEAMLSIYLKPARERPVEIEWNRRGILMKGELKLQKTEIEAIAKVKIPTYLPGFGTYIERYQTGSASFRDDPISAAGKAVVETVDKISVIVMSLGLLFSGNVPMDQIGGPIMLYKLSSEAAERGMEYFLSIIAFISINLGLINLFPIPILDGGLIAIFLVETVRKRPFPPNWRYAMNMVGLFLLVALMVFAFKNDIVRYWFST